MSQFYGSMQGSRGAVTRTGSKASGVEAHVRGWNVGTRTIAYFDYERNEDAIDVYLTAGSSGAEHDKFIGTFYAHHLENKPA